MHRHAHCAGAKSTTCRWLHLRSPVDHPTACRHRQSTWATVANLADLVIQVTLSTRQPCRPGISSQARRPPRSTTTTCRPHEVDYFLGRPTPGRQPTWSTNSRSTSTPVSRPHLLGFPWSASPKSTPSTSRPPKSTSLRWRPCSGPCAGRQGPSTILPTVAGRLHSSHPTTRSAPPKQGRSQQQLPLTCKFMENLKYKDWKAENEAKIGVRIGEVKSSGLERLQLSLELSSSTTTTRKFSLVNEEEEAKDAEEEEEEVQQVSERASTLPSCTTSGPRIRVTPQQRQGIQFPAAEEEGRGKRRVQAPKRLTYDVLGQQGKSTLAGAAMMVGDDEESEYEECAFVFFSPVEMQGEPTTLKEALESSDAEEWKKAMESELKSIEENGTCKLVELPEGCKAITSKWLFKIKSDADGNIECYKSRLFTKGYQEKEKVDFKELFAPVVKPTTLRTLLAGATIKGWVVKQMDVTTAFLNGVLEEEIFMA
ncbi:unnamed protein product [Closterium sp. NIES-53]